MSPTGKKRFSHLPAFATVYTIEVVFDTAPCSESLHSGSKIGFGNKMIQTKVSWYFVLLILAQVKSESNIIEGNCDWTLRLVAIRFHYNYLLYRLWFNIFIHNKPDLRGMLIF